MLIFIMKKFKGLIYMILGALIMIPVLPFLTSVRTLNNADALVIESWLVGVNLEEAAGYILENNIKDVWISGIDPIKSPSAADSAKQFEKFPKGLIGNGYIALFLKDSLKKSNIRLILEGHESKGYGAYYLIFNDGDILKSGFVSDKDTLTLHSVAHRNSPIVIAFLNDTFCKKGSDRNFILHSAEPAIALDRKEFAITGIDGFPANIPVSREVFIQKYLFDLGCENLDYEVFSTLYSGSNKTLHSALNFKKRLSQERKNSTVTGMNVYTSRHHAKRTYLNYKNALKGITEVGVVFPTEKENDCETLSWPIRMRSIADEYLSIIYTWYYWLF